MCYMKILVDSPWGHLQGHRAFSVDHQSRFRSLRCHICNSVFAKLKTILRCCSAMRFVNSSRSISTVSIKTYRLAIPALLTAADIALTAVQILLSNCVNSPVAPAFLPLSLMCRVNMHGSVSKPAIVVKLFQQKIAALERVGYGTMIN